MRKIATILTVVVLFISCAEKRLKTENVVSNWDVKDTIIKGLEMVLVPAGPYKAGRSCLTDSLSHSYWMGKYEITNGQFYRFLEDALKSEYLKSVDSNVVYFYPGDSIVPSGNYHVKVFDDRIAFENGQLRLDSSYTNHPVVSTTWYGAMSFCNFYGFELPTVEEWEKAARGMNCYRFPWGNEIDSTHANYLNSNDPFEPFSTPVGFYNGNLNSGFQTSNAASVYGCYDMVGNAWEWTASHWTVNTPYHMGKGGGYGFHSPAHLQIYYVSSYGPSKRPPLDMCLPTDGFRVMLREPKK